MSTFNITNTLRLIYQTPLVNQMLSPQHGLAHLPNTGEISAAAQAVLQTAPLICSLTTGRQLAPTILTGSPILACIALFGLLSRRVDIKIVFEGIKETFVLHSHKWKVLWKIVKTIARIIGEAGAYVIIEKAVDEGVNGRKRKQGGIDENLPAEKKPKETEKPKEKQKIDETEKPKEKQKIDETDKKPD